LKNDLVRFTMIALSVIFVAVGGYYRIQSQRSGERLDRSGRMLEKAGALLQGVGGN
jgi:hypothetical protein